MITAMYQALRAAEAPSSSSASGAFSGLSSHAGGGERWRGQPQHQQQQEESKEVKVSVWWDFQKCQLPPDANPCRVAPRVTAALRAAGIRGPVEITAFGDVFVLPRPVQEVLAATGVAFSHVPTSGKDGSDRSFIADLVYWIAQNPPPAHFFLISGDKHFANILHRLRMSNYNILLACPSTEPSILCSAATIMWPWEALVKGEGFTRKHFNQPPDGLSCSWYGDSQSAVAGEKSSTSMSSWQSISERKCLIETKNEKPRSSNVPSSLSDILSLEQKKIPVGDDPFLQGESKHFMNVPLQTKKPEETPRIPKAVVSCIRRALNSYPEGVNPEDLLSELKQNSSADSTSLSNDPPNNCSETDVKENFANTTNHCSKTIEISKAEKIRGSGESNKGMFSWAARWWSSGKSDKQDNQNHVGTRKDLDKGCAFVNSASGQQVGVEMFGKSYFWDALQQYLLTHHGSKLVSEAKAREDLAHGLQKGCGLLKGFDEKHIHQLVHLLISEKKWIKECRSETFHFQLTLPERGTCAPLHSCKPEGSSSPLTNGSTTISSKLFPARNGNSQASYKGNEDQGNVDDFAWEELGPVSSAGDPHPETDKVVRYHPPTLSDDESSDGETHVVDEQAGKDSDAEFSEDENHTASQQARRDPSRARR
ncbi:hypothetical protein ZWY2020_052735 [Hordeum vulgare]|nr:hypothetical protein ZWY2020_052735 [Hordeum vulgare]